MLTSKIVRISFLGLTVVTLVLGSYLIDIRDLLNQWQNLRQQETVINYTLKQTQQILQQAPNHLAAHFCTNFELTTLLDTLAKLAKNTQIDLQIIKPGTTQHKNQLIIYPLYLVASGKYPNFIAFNTALTQLNLLTSIPTYKIYSVNDSLVLAANIFAYKNSHCRQTTEIKFSGDATKIVATRDPFLKTYSQLNLELTQWDSSNLSFVGMISDNHNNIAIIEDPLGFIYHLTVGEKIGLKQAQVKQITATAIITDDVTQNIYWRN